VQTEKRENMSDARADVVEGTKLRNCERGLLYPKSISFEGFKLSHERKKTLGGSMAERIFKGNKKHSIPPEMQTREKSFREILPNQGGRPLGRASQRKEGNFGSTWCSSGKE